MQQQATNDTKNLVGEVTFLFALGVPFFQIHFFLRVCGGASGGVGVGVWGQTDIGRLTCDKFYAPTRSKSYS